MIGRYIALAGFGLLCATSAASAAHHRWVEVGRERHEICRCGTHLCGTQWTEAGKLYRCRSADSSPRRHKRTKR